MRKLQTPMKAAEAIYTTHSHGNFTIAVYECSGKEHVALIKDSVKGVANDPVRIQSACILGTALDSAECECREQLEESFNILDQYSNGVILYMDEEGRGQGLTVKIRGLKNKNKGMDTFQAVEALGLPSDVRDYHYASCILIELGVQSIQIITNNPAKTSGLVSEGIVITGRIPIEILATKRTRLHLQAKKKAGHLLKQPL